MHVRQDRSRPLDPQYRTYGVDLGTVGKLEYDPLYLARPKGHYDKLAGVRLHTVGNRVAEGTVVARRGVDCYFRESVPFRQERTSAAGPWDGMIAVCPSTYRGAGNVRQRVVRTAR